MKERKGRLIAALVLVSMLAAFQAPAQQLLPSRGFLTNVEGVPSGAVDIWSSEEQGLVVLTSGGCVWQQRPTSSWTLLFCESDLKKFDERTTLVKPPVQYPAEYTSPYNGELYPHTGLELGSKSLYFSTLCPVQQTQPTATIFRPCVAWRMRDYKTLERLVGNGDSLTLKNARGTFPGIKVLVDGVRPMPPDDTPVVSFMASYDAIFYQSGLAAVRNQTVLETVADSSLSGKGWDFVSPTKLLKALSSVTETDLGSGKTRDLFTPDGKFLGDKYGYWRYFYSGDRVLIPYMPYFAPSEGLAGFKPDRLVVMDLQGSMKQLIGPESETIPGWDVQLVKASGPLTIAVRNREYGSAPDSLWYKLDGQPWKSVARNGDANIRGLNISYYLAAISGCSVVFGTRRSSDTPAEAWYSLAVPCVLDSKVETGRAMLRGQNLTTVGNVWAVYDGGTRLQETDCRREADDVISCSLRAGDHSLWIEVDGVPSNKVQVTVEATAPPTPIIEKVSSPTPFTGCPMEGHFAPGSLIKISGTNLANSEVLVNGTPVAPLTVADTEIQFLLFEMKPGSTKLSVRVTKDGLTAVSQELEIEVLSAAPCLAEGNGSSPLIYNEAGEETHSAVSPGETVLLLATGMSAGLPAGIAMGAFEGGKVEISAVEGQPGVFLLRVVVPEYTPVGENPTEREATLRVGNLEFPIRFTGF